MRLKNSLFVFGILFVIFYIGGVSGYDQYNCNWAQDDQLCLPLGDQCSRECQQGYCEGQNKASCQLNPHWCVNQPGACANGGPCDSDICAPPENPSWLMNYPETCSTPSCGGGNCECNDQKCTTEGTRYTCDRDSFCTDEYPSYPYGYPMCGTPTQQRYKCTWENGYAWKVEPGFSTEFENGLCADGHDNDCDLGQPGGGIDCDDSDCTDDPLCSNPPSGCTLIFSEIYGSCSPDCDSGNDIEMVATFLGDCNAYPNLFFQIDAQASEENIPFCRIRYSGGDMQGISTINPLVYTNPNQITGNWVIPEQIPEICEGARIYAINAKVYDNDPNNGGNLIDELTSNLGGSFTFAQIPTQDCILTSARWNQTQAVEGDSVQLIVEGTGCDGTSVSFEIYEDDSTIFLPDDLVLTKSDNFDRTTWTALWTYPGDDDIGNDPRDYYFKATPSSGIQINSKDYTNGMLHVSKNPNPPDNYCRDNQITRCANYPDNNMDSLSRRHCDDDVCEVAQNGIPNGTSCYWNLSSTPKCNPELSTYDPDDPSFDPGICRWLEENTDTCDDDNWLTYSWTGEYIWNESNNYENVTACQEAHRAHPDYCIQSDGAWRYDPGEKAKCVSGQRTVPCSATIQLPFFNFWNVIGVLVMIILIYFLINFRKINKVKRLNNKKRK